MSLTCVHPFLAYSSIYPPPAPSTSTPIRSFIASLFHVVCSSPPSPPPPSQCSTLIKTCYGVLLRVVFPQLYLQRTLLVSCGDGCVRHRCVEWSLQCLIDATIAHWTHCPFSAVLGLFSPACPHCYPPPLPNTLVPRTSGLVVVCLSSRAFVYPPAHHPFLFLLPSLRPPTFALPNLIWLS